MIIEYMREIQCNVCDEIIGEEKPNWAEVHLKKHPTHKSYKDSVKRT